MSVTGPTGNSHADIRIQYFNRNNVFSPTGNDIQMINFPSGNYFAAEINNASLNPPTPMEITVTRDRTSYPASELYTVDISKVDSTQSTELIFQVLITLPQTSNWVATISDLGPGFVSVKVDNNDFGCFITVEFNTDAPSIFLPGSFDNLDNYVINLRTNDGDCVFSRLTQAYTNNNNISILSGLNSSIIQQNQVINYNISNSNSNNTINNTTIRIPLINIVGQTTALFGDNLSDYTFTVYDNRCYDDDKHARIGCDECVIDFIC